MVRHGFLYLCRHTGPELFLGAIHTYHISYTVYRIPYTYRYRGMMCGRYVTSWHANVVVSVIVCDSRSDVLQLEFMEYLWLLKVLLERYGNLRGNCCKQENGLQYHYHPWMESRRNWTGIGTRPWPNSDEGFMIYNLPFGVTASIIFWVIVCDSKSDVLQLEFMEYLWLLKVLLERYGNLRGNCCKQENGLQYHPLMRLQKNWTGFGTRPWPNSDKGFIICNLPFGVAASITYWVIVCNSRSDVLQLEFMEYFWKFFFWKGIWEFQRHLL